MFKMSLSTVFVAVIAVLMPSIVFAHHAEFMSNNPFWQGFSMPIHGIDHMLFSLAVGLIAAQIGGRALWSVPLVFAVAMLLGSILNVSGIAIPLLQYGILASLVICAALLSWRTSVSLLLTVGLIGLFTIFQGNAMTTEYNLVYSMPFFIVGCLISSLIILSIGVGLGLLISHLNKSIFRYLGVMMLAAAVVIGVFPDFDTSIIQLLNA
ncbi:TPA: HupE/UreJ family protein [Legionella pneumophila]|uniref:HupE / UreJ protein n=1 Tax=Legionella pneumophila subsp. pneumophila TaxID=91891 RepID=A0AAV2UW66_LEGPN|nr:HupE/UreJ family protein [Legionella pneumophila]MCZ4804593.1 HupE/UreJ family protein [Legionella pneumophila]MDW8856027.1 HupE/UreJ family protein [Legionella pneumophila]MDW8923299.1 HupE/UreJ family protein [Legionella pneumophila]MDW8929394.1 HupE/UreJ family protein [Legionella pneumophila]MDW8967584.1 HupE/UreJ family protein [Legionella pneumophila]